MTAASEAATAVGQRIRELRLRQGLSMRQLAAAVGVSQPFLSQLENGQSTPSMITLYGLAQQFGIAPGALLPGLQSYESTVVRANEGELIPVADRADAASGRGIVLSEHRTLELLEYDIAPGQYIEEWFSSEGETVIYVVSGQITVEIEGRPSVELGARDSVSMRGEIPHRFLREGPEAARVLIIIDRATFMRAGANVVPAAGSDRA
jgi:transcriptional regulator with XRE-family HTH domain